MPSSPPVLALVVPCFNEDEVVENTHKILQAKLQQLVKAKLIDKASFCCFVDDGSRDATWEKMNAIAGSHCHVIKLSFNSGQQNALMAGLRYVTDRCDCSITLDLDLQDDIEVIPEMLEHFRKGCEVVYGVRSDRSSDSMAKRNFALLYYRVSQLLGVAGIPNHSEFRLMSKRTLKILGEFNEYHMYLRGIVHSMNLPSAIVYYVRKARQLGETKYTPAKLIALALNGITSFSIIPLRIISVLGIACCCGSVLYAIYVVAGYRVSYSEPGWTSLIVSLYFLGGLIMLSLGVTGEYIGKIFLESKKRPVYVIEEIIDPAADRQSAQLDNKPKKKKSGA